MALESIDQCPLCHASSFTSLYTCEDFLSSHETFELKKCSSCSFIFTSPRPDPISLPSYYQSVDYVSHSGKATGIINLLYLQARKFTVRWKLSILRRQTPTPAVLDYGCGTGEFLQACLKKGWTCMGVEPSDSARKKANEITGIKIAGNLDDLESRKFDIITLWHVLEHIPDLNQKFKQLKLHLKENGCLMIAVPNLESLDGQYYKESWAGFDVPRHLWHFSRKTMNSLVTNHGLRIASIIPMKLDAYYVSVLSEKYKFPAKTALANLIHGVLHGSRSNRHASKTSNYSSLIYIIKQ